VHKSGLTALVRPSDTNSDNEQIVLQNTHLVDAERWDIGKLSEQAVKLWSEGKI